MRVTRHYVIDDTTRPLSAREIGAQSLSDIRQTQRMLQAAEDLRECFFCLVYALGGAAAALLLQAWWTA